MKAMRILSLSTCCLLICEGDIHANTLDTQELKDEVLLIESSKNQIKMSYVALGDFQSSLIVPNYTGECNVMQYLSEFLLGQIYSRRISKGQILKVFVPPRNRVK